MRPGEILDAHGDLIDRLADTRFAAFLNQVYAMDTFGHLTGDNPNAPAFRQAQVHAQQAAPTLRQHLRAAFDYRVTGDMSALIQHGAALLDEEDRIDISLAPTQAGIVGFDKPLPVKEVRGQVMLIHWLAWGPAMTPTGESASWDGDSMTPGANPTRSPCTWKPPPRRSTPPCGK